MLGGGRLTMSSLFPESEAYARGAIFDHEDFPDNRRRYRYLLWRNWGDTKRRVCWVLLNPSTADEEINDPTMAKCSRFSRKWGYGGMECVNVFAWRSSDPDVLYQVPNPIGPENDRYILEAVQRAQLVVLGWGKHGALHNRGKQVAELLKGKVMLYCLGVNGDNSPRHPLYIPEDRRPQLWSEK
jgi:hypothetical protein